MGKLTAENRRRLEWWVTGVAAAAVFGWFALFELAAKGGGTVTTSGEMCSVRLKKLWLGLSMYAEDYDGQLPGKDWMGDLVPYVVGGGAKPSDLQTYFFACPSVAEGEGQEGTRFGYSLFSGAAGKNLSVISLGVPVLFDSKDLRANSVGGLDLLPDPGRHGHVDNIMLGNGTLVFSRWDGAWNGRGEPMLPRAEK